MDWPGLSFLNWGNPLREGEARMVRFLNRPCRYQCFSRGCLVRRATEWGWRWLVLARRKERRDLAPRKSRGENAFWDGSGRCSPGLLAPGNSKIHPHPISSGKIPSNWRNCPEEVRSLRHWFLFRLLASHPSGCLPAFCQIEQHRVALWREKAEKVKRNIWRSPI